MMLNIVFYSVDLLFSPSLFTLPFYIFIYQPLKIPNCSTSAKNHGNVPGIHQCISKNREKGGCSKVKKKINKKY